MIKFNPGIDFKNLDKTTYNLACAFERALNIDVICTSTFRTPEYSEQVGGSRTDAHTVGKAIDIYTPDSKTRYKVIYAGLAAGFPRIGVGKTHIHLDNDLTKPWPIIFLDNLK